MPSSSGFSFVVGAMVGGASAGYLAQGTNILVAIVCVFLVGVLGGFSGLYFRDLFKDWKYKHHHSHDHQFHPPS